MCPFNNTGFQKTFLILLAFLNIGVGRSQVHQIPFAETCDFISQSPLGLIYLGTTDQAYTFDGLRLHKIALIHEGSRNIQSPFYFDDKDQIWFTSYDALWCYDNTTKKGSRYQIPLDSNTNANSDYYCFGWSQMNKILWIKQGLQIYQFDLTTKKFTQKASGISARRIIPASDKLHYFSYYYAYQPKVIQVDSKQEIIHVSGWNNWPANCLAQEIVNLDPNHVLIGSSCGLYIGSISSMDVQELKWKGSSLGPILSGTMLDAYHSLISSKEQGLLKISWTADYAIVAIQPYLQHEAIGTVDRMARDLNGTVYLSSYNQSISFFHPQKLIFQNSLFEGFQATYGFADKDQITIFDKSGNAYSENPSDGTWNLIKGTEALHDKNTHLFGRTEDLLKIMNPDVRSVFPQLGDSSSKQKLTSSDLFRLFKTESGNTYISATRGILLKWNESQWMPAFIFDPHSKIINYVSEIAGTYLLISINEEKIKLCDIQNPSRILTEIPFTGDIYHQLYDPVKRKVYFATTQGILIISLLDFKTRLISLFEFTNESECNCLLRDTSGHIWVSGKTKLIRLDPETEKIEVFGKADGIGSDEFLEGGCHKISDDSALFIKKKSLIRFRPSSLAQPCIKPYVYLSDFAINYTQTTNPDTLNTLKALQLRYQQNTISFTVRGMNFSDPQEVHLSYFLEPFESGWNSIQKEIADVNYIKLKPGHYTFHVKAISSNGTCESRAYQLPIEILTPFWMKAWFRFLVLFTLMLIGLLIFRAYYVRQLEKKDLILREQKLIIDKQNAIEMERSRIASEMHDDLGSGLTTIRYLSDRALRQAGSEAERQQIKRISDQSHALLRNMSEIIWALNIRNDSLANLLAYLRRYALEFLEEKQISISWEQDAIVKDSRISGEHRRDILLVIKELLNNIVKHSGASNVDISIQFEGSIASIRIHDNGIGFDPESNQEKGNGIYNMQKRMSKINGKIHFIKVNKGSTVELQFQTDSEIR